MRGRAIGLVVLGVGAFALVAALLLRVLVVPTAVRLPLAQSSHPVANGTDVEWFSVETGQAYTGVSATVKEDVTDVQGEGTASTAVWDVKSVIRDDQHQDKDGQPLVISKSAYTVCLDRGTAEAQPDCTSASSAHGKIHGLTLNFPFGTGKQTYGVYDPTTGKTFPARFQAVERIQGLTVYRFEQDVPQTVVEQQKVPGAMAGAPEQAAVDADFVYSSTRTFWVEPTTGMIISLQEKPDIVVRGPGGTTGITWLSGTFTASDATVGAAVKDARDNRSNIVLIGTVLPWTLVGVGLLGLLVGSLLLSIAANRSRGEDTGRPVTPAPVPQAG